MNGEQRRLVKRSHTGNGQLSSFTLRRTPEHIHVIAMHVKAEPAPQYGAAEHAEGFIVDKQLDGLGISYVQHGLFFVDQSI